MYWVVVATDWSGSIVQVLGDDDTLPGCEWRYRLVTEAEDYERAQWLANLERRRINTEQPRRTKDRPWASSLDRREAEFRRHSTAYWYPFRWQ